MIKVSFISPTSLVEQYGNQGDIHLVLSHLLDEENVNDYEAKLRLSGKPLFLDNGLYENKTPEGVESLIKKALRIDAEYFFAPDFLYDREATEKSIDTTWEAIEKHKSQLGRFSKTKLAAVVQADNDTDYIESYKKFVADPRISLIGLSILSVPKSFQRRSPSTTEISRLRMTALSILNELPQHKDSHLLGAGSSYEDVAYAEVFCPWVVSHDSSSAVWNGIQGKKINIGNLSVEGGKTPIPVDFDWDESLSEQQQENIQHNINIILKETGHK